jgi:hypothetical protein
MAGGTHNTGLFANAFDKRIRKIYMNDYLAWPSLYDKLAKIESVKGNYIMESDLSTFGTMETTPEGGAGSIDAMKQGDNKTQRFTQFTHNAQVTRVMKDDDESGMIQKFAKAQARSTALTIEYLFWDQCNSGFSASTSPETGLDGLSLFNDSHDYIDNGAAVQDNQVATALSYAAIQTAVTAFRDLKDQKGHPMYCEPNLLVVPTALEWKAEEILGAGAKLDPTNANNTINTVKSILPGLKYMVVPFLTSATAWFLFNTELADLRWLWRVKPEYSKWDDGNTENTMYKAYMRVAATHFNWRGAYGSSGA